MGEIKLPSHWKELILGNIAQLTSGGTPSRTKPEYWNGNIPWVKTGEINYGIITDAEEKITQEGLNNSSAKIIPANTLLMAMYGQGITRGRVAILGIDAAINQACCAIFINNHVALTAFIFYFLYYSYEKIRNLGHGANQKNLNSALIKSIEIYLPSLPEQKEIAHTLRTIQKAKETRQRELELERERKAALMQYLFTHGTRNEPRKDKETGIGEIPKSWEIVSIKEFIVGGIQNGLYKPLDLYGKGTPIVRINDFDNDGKLLNDTLQRVYLSLEEIDKYSLNEKDIIINRVNSLSHLGKCTIIQKITEKTVFESNMMRLRVDNKKIMPEFVFRYLTTHQCRNYLRSIAKRAVGQSSINQGDIKSLFIPTPNLCEQNEIVDSLQACDRKISALEKEIAILDELFHAMLEQLMTGKLSTQPLINQEA